MLLEIKEIAFIISTVYTKHFFVSLKQWNFFFVHLGPSWWACQGHVSAICWHGEQTGWNWSSQSYLLLLFPDLWPKGERLTFNLMLWCTQISLRLIFYCYYFKVTANFWQTWKEFEIRHGNEDTIREMLRIKRSVQATYNTQVNFMSSQMLKATTSSTGTSKNKLAANTCKTITVKC